MGERPGAGAGPEGRILLWSVPVALAVGLLSLAIASRAAGRSPDPSRLAAEGARLRAEAEARGARIAALEKEATPAAGEGPLRMVLEEESARLRRLEDRVGAAGARESGTAGRSETLARLEGRVAALEAIPSADPRADAEARAKRILEDLAAVNDDGGARSVEKWFRELVRLGDPAVPSIEALLDTGLQRDYRGRDAFGMGAGQLVHCSLRTVLLDALGQIGSPAARNAALRSAERSRSLSDLRTLLAFYRDETDPEVVTSLSARVREALPRVAALGAEKADEEVSLLSHWVVPWIRRHRLADTAGSLEAIVVRATPSRHGGWSGPDLDYFALLVTYSPEGAVRAVLELERFHAGRTPLRSFSFSFVYSQPIPRAACAKYLDLLLARGNLDAGTRSHLYWGVPVVLYAWPDMDPAARTEDARPLVEFLESRRDLETDPAIRAVVEGRIGLLRMAIEEASR